MLLKLLGKVAGLVKARLEKPNIDNNVCHLHYRFTAAIFFLSCILVTASALIGKPIQCISEKSISGVIDTYCWIMSTFTLANDDGKVGHGAAAPGVGPHTEEDEQTYHAYYQWVPFVLFLQGMLFYAPHYIWKSMEGGKLSSLLKGMTGQQTQMLNKVDRDKKVQQVVQYLMNSLHLHNGYAAKFVFCEILNFVNVVGNIFFINRFLGGGFLNFGSEVLAFANTDQDDRYDPMITVFPRQTKCTFHSFGPSGSVQRHDAFCLLAINIINEKIYVFLWFWLVTLSVITGVSLLYRLVVVQLPLAREALLAKHSGLGRNHNLGRLVERTQYGDFFLLYMLGRNMHSLIFGELLKDYQDLLEEIKTPPTLPRKRMNAYPLLPLNDESVRLYNEKDN